MESLYHQTNSLLEQTQGYFIRLEQGGAREDTRLEAEIRERLETMWANTERLDMMAGKETAVRRQVARQKIDQLKYDIQHLHSALQVHHPRLNVYIYLNIISCSVLSQQSNIEGTGG